MAACRKDLGLHPASVQTMRSQLSFESLRRVGWGGVGESVHCALLWGKEAGQPFFGTQYEAPSISLKRRLEGNSTMFYRLSTLLSSEVLPAGGGWVVLGLLSKIKSELGVKSASRQRGGHAGADARRGGRGEVGGLGGGRARTARVAGGGGVVGLGGPEMIPWKHLSKINFTEIKLTEIKLTEL